MKLVDELLQNIRFLKFYGWGQWSHFSFATISMTLTYIISLEYDWSRKTEDARETELKWRVRNNIVDTAVSFIW